MTQIPAILSLLKILGFTIRKSLISCFLGEIKWSKKISNLLFELILLLFKNLYFELFLGFSELLKCLKIRFKNDVYGQF